MFSSGIRFNDCFFTEPTCLETWNVPKFAGLFVILAGDSNWAPKPYQPLYFGEFGNNTPETPLPTDCPGIEKGARLYVAVLPMPFSTTAQRWALRNELLRAYNPISQTRGTTQPPLPPFLAGSEHLDQKPRQRIGFLP